MLNGERNHDNDRGTPSENRCAIALQADIEALARAEIAAGFSLPRYQSDDLVDGVIDSGQGEDAVRESARNLYVSLTAAKARVVQGLIARLTDQHHAIAEDLDAVRERQATQRQFTYSRVEPERHGRMGALDRINILKYPAAAVALMLLGWYAMRLILANSGDLSDGSLGSDPSSADTGLSAGAFVTVISFGAFALEVLHSKIRTDEGKDKFHGAITIAAYVCTTSAGALFALMYASSMGDSIADTLGGLGDSRPSPFAKMASSDVLPVILIACIIIGEALMAATLWIRAELIYDEYRPVQIHETPEQEHLASRRAEHEQRSDTTGTLIVQLNGMADEIVRGEACFIDMYLNMYRTRAAETQAFLTAERARFQLREAEAACRPLNEPSLFRFRQTGGAS